MTKKRTIILFIGLLSLLAVGIATRWGSSIFSNLIASSDNKGEAPASANGSDEIVLACTGRIEGASEAISVGAGIDGVIAEIRVKEGETVAAGAILAIIERREFGSQLAEAQAAIARTEALRERLLRGSREEERQRANAETAAAEALARQTQAKYERFERLFQQGVVAADARDEALRNAEVARATLRATQKSERFINLEPLAEELDRADAEIRAAREGAQTISEQMKKCEIKAPIAATVLRTNMKIGETYSTFMPQPIVTLADTSSFHVRAEVDERDVGKISLGQRVLIHSDAFGESKILGKVSRLSSQMGRKKARTGDPAEKSDRDVLEVLIDVEGKDRALVVGLRVTAQFLSRQ